MSYTSCWSRITLASSIHCLPLHKGAKFCITGYLPQISHQVWGHREDEERQKHPNWPFFLDCVLSSLGQSGNVHAASWCLNIVGGRAQPHIPPFCHELSPEIVLTLGSISSSMEWRASSLSAVRGVRSHGGGLEKTQMFWNIMSSTGHSRHCNNVAKLTDVSELSCSLW